MPPSAPDAVAPQQVVAAVEQALTTQTPPLPLPRPTVPTAVSALLDERGQLFARLRLQSFAADEIAASRALLSDDGDARALADKLQLKWDAATDDDTFVRQVRALAERIDARVYPIAGSFLFAGISIGAIIPILPVLAAQVHLTPFTFSLVVAAFAASRLVGNVYAATWSETKGRKRTMVGGLLVCASAFAVISATPSLATLGGPAYGATVAGAWLIGARLGSGFGVALFNQAALVMLSSGVFVCFCLVSCAAIFLRRCH